MLCRQPYVKGELMPYPCGQCMPCRLNRRRLWTHRLLLEQLKSGDSCFVTLTYSEENHPPDGSVNPKHLSDWLKRFRKLIAPKRVRYYGVGEYGDETARPHYHLALFGVGREFESLIRDSWGLGHVLVGDLTRASAQYVAGYVTKKLTKVGDPRLGGRHPEFARMSLRPGIGALAMEDVAAVLNDSEGAKLIARDGDVPLSLKHGGKDLPLGRYLRRRLRNEMGFEVVGGQSRPQEVMAQEMRQLRETVGRAAFVALKPFVETAKINQIEGRAKLWRKKESL